MAKKTNARTAAPAIGVSKITHEMIAKRAFEIWCGKGRPSGTEAENWREAQEALSQELGFATARGSSGADARS